jgi:arginase
MEGRRVVVLDAPSNLGLRPPEEGAPPGCYKLPWALRDRGLLKALAAEDAGALVPPRYRAKWKLGEGDRNAEAIADYSVRLADRVGRLFDPRSLVIVLGGDCSVLLGHTLALRRGGRHGLVFLDAHSDFRHPGNSKGVGAAAGEDLAIVTGRGDSRLIHLEGLGPYVREEDVHVVGVRPNDECLTELSGLGIAVTTSSQVNDSDAAEVAHAALATVTRATLGFWIHLDLDVVDSGEMPAVDCPEPDGLSFATLTLLVGELLASPQCLGMELTIYDPDLDPEGLIAERIVTFLREAIARA